MGVNYRRPLGGFLSVIRQGLELELMVEPSQRSSPLQINMNFAQKSAINKEIKRLLAVGCIKEVKRTERVFLSNIFTVPKKNKDLRLVINLKDLNQFLAFHHFKMESFQTAKDLMQDKTGFGRSLSFSSRDTRSSEMFYLPLGWQMLCLLCSSLWAGSSPRVVYRNHKTNSCSFSTESGDLLCYIFRRPPDFWEDQDRLPFKRQGK